MSKRIILTKNAPAPIGPYSQGTAAQGELVFTAGQVAIIPSTGNLLDGDVRAQTRQTLENLKAVLEAAGSNLANVVKTTVFLKDMNDFPAMNEVYGQYFAESPPARTTVEASRLPRDVRVEIDAVGLVIKK